MNELAKNVESFNAPLAERPASIMDIIGRAANDPAFDVNKFERLLEMHERIMAKEAKAAYMTALVAMKPLLPVIERNGKITIKKKDTDIVIQSTAYALWEDIDAKITPILRDHGFALTFRSGVAHDGKITVTGVLGHCNGHSEETTITLPHDSSGSKNAVQAVGSSTSYGKRYTATLLLNIRTKGEDDDGQKGGEDALVGDDQIEKIFDLIKRTSADTLKFCSYMGVESVADIPRKDFDKAMRALNLKEKKIAK